MKRLISALLVVLIFALPLATAQASNNYSVLSGSDVLRRGSKGSHVRQVQQRLIDLGYLTGSADGSYGAKTEAAVRAFQQKNGFSGAAGYSGVATMLTQAVLLGNDCLAAWENGYTPCNTTGSYAISDTDTRYFTGVQPAFTFINRDIRTVEAVCIYYWLQDYRNHLVKIGDYEYWMQWYYGMNVPSGGTFNVSTTLNPTNSQLGKADSLRMIVGEIAYTDGSVNINFNASRKPYESSNYIIGSWD